MLIGGVVKVNVVGRMAVVTPMLVLAVGCADQGTAAVPLTQPSNEPQLQEVVVPPERTISARISNGKVEGVPGRFEVDRGDRVRIEVTSDRSDELHIHGYDKTVPLTPGSQAAVAFVADLPGVFEVESHDSGLLLFQLVVRG